MMDRLKSKKRGAIGILATLLGIVLTLACCTASPRGNGPPTILVTVSPYHQFVQRIVGDRAKIKVLVPPGVSGHDYEPNPRHTLEASQAKIWFRIGEPFEDQAIKAFTDHNPEMEVVDLREDLSLLPATHHHHFPHHHHKEVWDTHIWLSPPLMVRQIQTIADGLQKLFPEIAQEIQDNARQLTQDLQRLDRDIRSIWRQGKSKTVLVAHPAYTYYCRTYGIEQLSLEVQGRDPTPHEVTELLQTLRQKNLKRIFVQQEYAGKGARVVAEELQLQIITLDPFSGDYFDNMLTITRAFAGLTP